MTHSSWAVQNGRDQLSIWRAFDATQNAELPAEEPQEVKEGADYGWPYCYFDAFQNKRFEAPEYGGDGRTVADCAKYAKPVALFPRTTRRSTCCSTLARSFLRTTATACSSRSTDRGTARRCLRGDTT